MNDRLSGTHRQNSICQQISIKAAYVYVLSINQCVMKPKNIDRKSGTMVQHIDMRMEMRIKLIRTPFEMLQFSMKVKGLLIFAASLTRCSSLESQHMPVIERNANCDYVTEPEFEIITKLAVARY